MDEETLMIRCKLISPTNLMLEHPLLLSAHDEPDFFVVGKKEYNRKRLEWIRYGVLIGTVSSVGATALVSLIVWATR